MEEVHFEEALRGVCIEDGPLPLFLGVVCQSECKLVEVEGVDVLLGPEFLVALVADIGGTVLVESEFGLHLYVLYSRHKQRGGRVGANLVPAAIGLGHFEEGQE